MTLPENHPARLFSLEQVLEATERFRKRRLSPKWCPSRYVGAMLEFLGDLHVVTGSDGKRMTCVENLGSSNQPNLWRNDRTYFLTEQFRPATKSEIRAVFEQQEAQS